MHENKELLFVWVESYKALRNQCVHFSNRYRFEVDSGKRTIEVKQNPDHIEGFWGEGITSVSGVLGKNGVGKSTCLKFAIEALAGAFDEQDVDYLIAISTGPDTDDICVVFSRLEWSSSTITDIRSTTSEDDDPVHRSFQSIYYSQAASYVFQAKDRLYAPEEGGEFFDISNDYLLTEDRKSFAKVIGAANMNDIDGFRSMGLYRQILFIAEWQKEATHMSDHNIQHRLGFELPSHLVLSPLSIGQFAPIPSGKESSSREAFLKFRSSLEVMLEQGDHDIVDSLMVSLMLAHAFDLLKHEDKLASQVASILVTQGELSIWPVFDGFIDGLIPILEGSPYDYYVEAVYSAKDLVEHLYRELIQESEDVYVKNNPVSIHVKIKTSYPFMINMVNLYSKSILDSHFITFSWSHSISSGQQAKLDLFARLWWLREGDIDFLPVTFHRLNRVKGFNSLILFLDECDSQFHPKWQQELVDSIVQFVPICFQDMAVQIVFAANSPFIASDIPRDCLTVLGHQDSVPASFKTFGANIHDLYRHPFFMDGLVMGEFASKRIRLIVRYLSSVDGQQERPAPNTIEREKFADGSDERSEEKREIASLGWELHPDRLEQTILMIGEDVLRQKLHERFRDVMGDRYLSIVDEERQVAQIEAEAHERRRKLEERKNREGSE